VVAIELNPRSVSGSRSRTDGSGHWPFSKQHCAALEDKIVQAAMVTLLSQIYEVDFLGFSYGFRPGKSQHNALDAVSVGLLKRKVNWILDADIQGFSIRRRDGELKTAPMTIPSGSSNQPPAAASTTSLTSGC
jgi:hypothetical protein